MSQSARIQCNIVSPHGSAVDGQIADITLPAHDGLVGILADHVPMLCELGVGVAHYHDENNQLRKIFIDGGFLHVCNNEVLVLTTQALTADDVNRQKAEAQLREAESMPHDNAALRTERQKAMRRAKSLLELVE